MVLRCLTGEIACGRIDKPLVRNNSRMHGSLAVFCSTAQEDAREVGVHFVGKCNTLTDQLDGNLKRMWDLESMGWSKVRKCMTNLLKILNLRGVDIQINYPGEAVRKNSLVITN